MPVSIGFTSATSVIIVVSQLKGLLGLSFSSDSFIDNVRKVVANLPNVQFGDATLGFTCIVVLLLLRVRPSQFHPGTCVLIYICDDVPEIEGSQV